MRFEDLFEDCERCWHNINTEKDKNQFVKKKLQLTMIFFNLIFFFKDCIIEFYQTQRKIVEIYYIFSSSA